MTEKTFKERLEEKFRVTPGCWIWIACSTKGGYGQISKKRKMVMAHRAAYELYVEAIQDGLIIRHKCDNPRCVNPDHLVPGTYKDNMQDMYSRNRQADMRGRTVGEKHGKSKLTEMQVLEILSDTRTQGKIAEDYRVSRTCIGDIKRRRLWAYLGT